MFVFVVKQVVGGSASVIPRSVCLLFVLKEERNFSQGATNIKIFLLIKHPKRNWSHA